MPRFTFGYEAEFENNVEPLLARLHEQGLAGDSNLHGYHCRCESCNFTSGWAYRGQNDSSCGGEIISAVCSDWDVGRDWMTALEVAAVEVDAEPSLRAGFHVHVGMSAMIRRGLFQQAVLLNYLLWEPVLGELATGRWPSLRSFNSSLRDVLAYVRLTAEGPDGDSRISWDVWDVLTEDGVAEDITHDLRNGNMGTFLDQSPQVQDAVVNIWTSAAMEFVDRHAWVSFQTRNRETVEFRLWNSTRSAWRMELAARTSLLFVNPDAYVDMLAKAMTAPTLDALASLAAQYDPGLEALIERQMTVDKTDRPFTVLAA